MKDVVLTKEVFIVVLKLGPFLVFNKYLSVSCAVQSSVMTSCCCQLCLILLRPHEQSSLSMGFPRHEYWSRLSFPSPGHLLDPGIKPESPALAGRFFTTKPPDSARQVVLKNTVTIQISPTIEVFMNHCFQGAKGVMYSLSQDWGQKIWKE